MIKNFNRNSDDHLDLKSRLGILIKYCSSHEGKGNLINLSNYQKKKEKFITLFDTIKHEDFGACRIFEDEAMYAVDVWIIDESKMNDLGLHSKYVYALKFTKQELDDLFELTDILAESEMLSKIEAALNDIDNWGWDSQILEPKWLDIQVKHIDDMLDADHFLSRYRMIQRNEYSNSYYTTKNSYRNDMESMAMKNMALNAVYLAFENGYSLKATYNLIDAIERGSKLFRNGGFDEYLLKIYNDFNKANKLPVLRSKKRKDEFLNSIFNEDESKCADIVKPNFCNEDIMSKIELFSESISYVLETFIEEEVLVDRDLKYRMSEDIF